MVALWVIWGLLVAFPAASVASSALAGIKFSGFGTIGLVRGGDDVLGYRRDLSADGVFDNDWSAKIDTLLGLQVDAPLTKELNAAVQLVAKDRYNNTLDESLEWANLRYRPTPELTLRGGRLGLDLFILSDYRNLGFSYLWARPPIEFYGPIFYSHFDGVDVTYTTNLKEGLFRVRLFTGSNQITLVLILPETDVDTDQLVGATLGWEFDNWQVRLGVATLKQRFFDADISQLTTILQQAAVLWPEAAGIADGLEDDGGRVNYFSAGFTYDSKPWTTQSEISYIDSEYNVVGSILSAYLSLGRRTGAVTLYGVGALAKSPDARVQVPLSPPPLAELQQQVQTTYNLSFVKQHSLSLGMRWDIRYDLALKVQWDHTWIDEYGGALLLQKQPFTNDASLDTFSINLNFVF
jgi:hypothetical protein